MADKNKAKIKEAEDKYWNAVNLPRKLKKKVRKQANIDYSFWKSIDAWCKQTLTF